jgi:hypothetical protein
VRRLRPDNAAKKRVLVVEGVERSKEKFLGLNHEACSFFAMRFKGLAETLVGQVTFRHVEAFKYDEFQSDISEHKRRTPGATSRKARQLHFRVSLEEDDLPAHRSGWSGSSTSGESARALAAIWNASSTTGQKAHWSGARQAQRE